MEFSMIPLLLVVMLVLFILAVRRTEKVGLLQARGAKTIYVLICTLILWGISNTLLSVAGVYSSPSFLNLMPGLWLPMAPMVMSTGAVLSITNLRNALFTVAKYTPQHQLLYFQALRILALGTLIKAYRGEFPVYFAVFVGIPDLLFGLSAVIFGNVSRRRSFSRCFLIIWNVVGFIIILPAVPLFQMGLSGAMQVFTAEPTAMRLLEFPMVLAPTLIVPMFILVNLLAARQMAISSASGR